MVDSNCQYVLLADTASVRAQSGARTQIFYFLIDIAIFFAKFLYIFLHK